ncbi:MAG: aminotransferase class I/II-fold pyridoxal phosphate-dependent enzyme, partial [Acidobacteriota bacterium]
MSNTDSKHRLGTLALHAGQEPDPATGARAVPIYSTSSYVFRDTAHAANLFALKEFGYIYSRLMNPTCDVLEKRMAALEGGAGALAFASGQAATTAAILTITHAGQNIVSSTSLYGGTWTLFTQTLRLLGIEVRFFNPDHPEEIHKLVDANTRLVFLESVGNPRNDVPDFQAISDIAHSHGLPVLLDNTVLTPALFKPFDHGVDISIYSTTKFLGGHGVHVGGIVVDSGKFPWAADPQKWPEFTEPDPAYHGMVFTEALAPLGNIAFIVH